MRLILTFGMVILVGLQSACFPPGYSALPAPERATYADQNLSGRPREIQLAFREGRIIPGMTALEATMITHPTFREFEWVKSQRISASGTTETWVARNGRAWTNEKGWYVCTIRLLNGVVESIYQCPQ